MRNWKKSTIPAMQLKANNFDRSINESIQRFLAKKEEEMLNGKDIDLEGYSFISHMDDADYKAMIIEVGRILKGTRPNYKHEVSCEITFDRSLQGNTIDMIDWSVKELN